MSALKKCIKDSDLISLTIPSNIVYGTPIYERGAVEIIRISDTEVEAWSGGLDGTLKQGSGSRRRVKLWIEGNALKWHCSGNPKNHDVFCKHCVAVALFLKNS